MNADHFTFIQGDDLDFAEDFGPGADADVMSKARLDKQLLQDFAALPKNPDYSRYGVVNVSPSVVPNPYLPSFRVYSYNVSQSAIADDKEKSRGKQGGYDRPPGRGVKSDHCKKGKHKDTWRCHLSKQWHSDPDAPSRTNVLWTPLGYAQYFMPALENANLTHAPKFRLEYITYAADMLHPTLNQTDFQYPVPLRRLPRTLRNVSVTESKYAPYGMRDLTIPSWLRLARALGDAGNQGLRKKFRKFMFMGKGSA